jgi:hypothetical protein
MDDLQRLIIENECRKLAVLYCWHLDHLDPEAFAALYTEDAQYKPAIEPKPIIGRDAILDWIRAYPKRRLGRHVSTNHFVEVIDEEHAVGSSYAVVFRDPEPTATSVSPRVTPRSVVEYVDNFRRTPAGWRFASRYYQMLFLEAEQTARPEPWSEFPKTIGTLTIAAGI